MSITSQSSDDENNTTRLSMMDIKTDTAPWSIIDQTTSEEMKLKLAKDGFESIIQKQGTIGIVEYFDTMKEKGLIENYELEVATHIHIKFTEYTGRIGEIGLDR